MPSILTPMTRATTALLLASCLLVSACDEDDAGGNAPPVETHDGVYEGVDNMVLNVEVTAPGSAPIDQDCLGEMAVTVDLSATPQITGTGNCLLPANAASYTLEGNFDTDDNASGTLHIVFNGQNHDIPWSGSFDTGEVTATAVGTTPATATININWDGNFDAARP